MSDCTWIWHPDPDSPGPSAAQRAFMEDTWHRDLSFLGGFGSGKTHAAAQKCASLSAFNEGTTIGAIGQSLPNARQDLVPAIELVLGANNVEYELNKSELTFNIRWPWQGRIKVATAAVPETLQGPNWSAFVGNEPGLWELKAYRMACSRVRVRWTSTGRRCINQRCLCGTPEGFNWLYDETVKKYPKCMFPAGQGTRRVIFTSTLDAEWLPDWYVDDLRDRYPSDLLDEKVHGIFTLVGGNRVYSTFKRKLHVIDDLDFVEGVPLILCLDFNISPAMAVIHQRIPNPNGKPVTHAVDEIALARGYTGDVIQAFCDRHAEKAKAWGLEIIGDSSGKHASAAGPACFDVAYQKLRENGVTQWRDRTPSSNPFVKERWDVVNGVIEKGRYFVSPRCARLIGDREQIQTEEDGTFNKRKMEAKGLTHFADADDYDLYDFYQRPKATNVKASGGKRESAFEGATL
ncbi:MAG: hypothetical protein AB7K09_23125 [Planctomycetota bacterium]